MNDMGFDQLVQHIEALIRGQGELAKAFADLGQRVTSIEKSSQASTGHNDQSAALYDAISQISGLSDERHQQVEELSRLVSSNSDVTLAIKRDLEMVQQKLISVDRLVADIAVALNDRSAVVLDISAISKRSSKLSLRRGVDDTVQDGNSVE